MANKRKVKNKDLRRLGIEKDESGNYVYAGDSTKKNHDFLYVGKYSAD